MRCLGCLTDNEVGLRFCDQCGAELRVACTQCGSPNRPAANFCGHCAAPLPATRHTGLRSPPAERRQLTVLFCDLVDSTAISGSLDAEDWRDLLRSYQTQCADVVRQLDGYVAQYLGDGLLVYFGYPRAHEDGPVRAVRAGLAIVTAIETLSAQTRSRFGVTLQVRVGVHTGPVVVGQMGDPDRSELLAVGETPNLAARIQTATRPNSVVVSDVTHRLTEAHFAFRELGPLTAKGFARPTVLFEVERAAQARERLEASGRAALTPLVGRSTELRMLGEHWVEALEGATAIVAISGEPGIGKSRLVRSLAESLDANRHLYLRAQAAAVYQGTVLHPILELIEERLELGRAASPQEKLERLRAGLARVDVQTADALPLLAAFLSIPDGGAPASPLSPSKRRHATFEVLVGWLHSMVQKQPVLLAVEDVHWADPSTLELLGLLIERPSPGPLMVVITHRPEFVPTWASSKVQSMRLTRLGNDDSLQILRAVVGGRPVPREVEREVCATGEGVPLYIEEIAKALGEAGAPAADLGVAESAPPSLSVAIPSGVRDSFMARIDRLGPTKALLQLGATLGRTFSADVLGAVSGMDTGSLHTHLERLLLSGLLLQTGAPPRATYTFKHALLQDAAYDSLLRSTRREYHAQIAKTLRDRFPETAEAQPELLAHHYAGAGMAREAVEKFAVVGQRAIARSAYLEAQRALNQALAQLKSLPPSRDRDRLELDLRSALGFALTSTRGYAAPEVEDNCNRASDLCAQFGDPPLEVLYGTWSVHLVRSDRTATARLAEVIQRSIETSTDGITLIMAHASLGVRAFYLAEYGRAREHFENARALAAKATAGQVVTAAFEGYIYPIVYSAWCDMIAGDADKAQANFDRALAIAEADSNPYAVGLVLGFAAAAARDANDVARVRALSERNLSLSIEHGFPMWVGLSNVLLGWAEARSGQFESGVARLAGALALLRSIGSFITLPYHQGCLAEAYLLQGQVDQADAIVEEARAFAEGRLASNYAPMLLKLKGDVLAARGDANGAEERYASAAATLGSQGARLFELQVALAWARLPGRRGGLDRLRGVVASLGLRSGLPDLDLARDLVGGSAEAPIAG